MLSTWYTVLFVLAFGSRTNALGLARSFEEGDILGSGDSLEAIDIKSIFTRDNASTNTTTSTYDYDLSFSLLNAPLVSDSLNGGSVSITCKTCQTFGTAAVSTTGINRNESFFSDVANLVRISKSQGFAAAVADAVDLNISVDFLNTSGTFDFATKFSGSASQTFNLFTLPVIGLASPLDGQKDNIGVVLLLDLIFSSNAVTDFVTGFEVGLGDGASIDLDPIGGKILSSSFPGLSLNVLPSTITDPELSFTATLRATLEVGTTITVDLVIDSVDVSFEAGVFVDLVNYSANVTDAGAGNITLSRGSSAAPPPLNTTVVVVMTACPANSTVPPFPMNGTSGAGDTTSPSCSTALFQEELSSDVGAFATASDNITLPFDVAVGGGFDFNKAVTTTLLALPLPTVCI